MVCVLSIAGDQVPLMPLSDVLGKAGTVSPAQMVSEVPKLNDGVMVGFTVTVKLVGDAQRPAAGVNV